MTDDTQPEALRIADEFRECLEDRDAIPSIIDVEKAVAELCRQHARIAELEAQLESIGAGGVSGPLIGQPQAMPDLTALAERGAKAWAGVDAQALREGCASPSVNAGEPSGHIKEPYTLAEIKAKIASNDYSAEMLLQHAMLLLDSASLAANAGEPVYQARYQKGFWQDSSRERYEYLQNPENTCAEDWETRILYTHPPTAQAGGWISVDERLPDLMVDVLAGYWYQDTWMKGKPLVFSYGVCRMYEMPDDPCFPQGKRWQTHGCAHSQLTHWMPLPPPPTSAEGVEHG